MDNPSLVEIGIIEAVDFIKTHNSLLLKSKEDFFNIENAKKDIIKYSNTFFKKIKVNILVSNILKNPAVRNISNQRIMSPEDESNDFSFVKDLTSDNFSNSSLSKTIYPKRVKLISASMDLGEHLSNYAASSSSLIGFHNQLISTGKNIYALICLSSFEEKGGIDTLNYATKFLKKIDNDPELRRVFDLDKGSVFRLKECLERSISRGDHSDIIGENAISIPSLVSDMEACESNTQLKITQ